MTNPTETVRKARDLIVATGYTTGTYARNARKAPVDPCSVDAVAFCIAGAIAQVAKHDDIDCQRAWNLVTGPFETSKVLKKFDTFSKAQAVEFLSRVIGDVDKDEGTTKAETLANDLLKA